MIEREELAAKLTAKRISDLEAKLAEAEADVKRLLEIVDSIEAERFYNMRLSEFAAQVLSGEFDPPTIAEIRKARGLDPL